MDAKMLAQKWIAENRKKDWIGAIVTGSAAWSNDPRPATSDVDVLVVVEGPEPAKFGKFPYAGEILDVSFVARDRVASAEVVLADPHLAEAFRRPNIVTDRDGFLAGLQRHVQAGFADPVWVQRRVAAVRTRVLGFLEHLDKADSFADQVIGLVFANGVMTHVLLVAGLRNPTVRRRYAEVRTLLHERGMADFYEDLLKVLGVSELTRAEVVDEIPRLAAHFDRAAEAGRTAEAGRAPEARGASEAGDDRLAAFRADINPAGRAVVIDGSRELADSGLHREAFFWMIATAAKAQAMLDPDDDTYLRHLVGMLGTTPEGLRERGGAVRDFLPRLDGVAERLRPKKRAP
jgi:hypothetical protein